ncbi:MAG: hypothetical protein ABUL60_06125, partial [Myxococcales bacterium]
MNHAAISVVSSTPPASAARWPLGALLAFGACNAFGGGWYGLSGASGVPKAWLAHTPFQDYFVPSFVLLIVVGGALGSAALAVLLRAAFARRAAFAAGGILLAWIVVQVAIIGYVSWLQPTTLLASLLVLILASGLPRSKAEAGSARAFFSYYRGALRAPRATFDALRADPRRLRFGTWALASNAALYTLVYLFLVMGNGRPTVFKPWLALPAESYYRYDAFLLAPSMFAGWLLAAGVVQLFGKLTGVASGSFEDTLAVLGFSIAIASWST